MATLLLFDIDGTLILTGGAGARGMTRAFLDVFGVPDAFTGIPMPGRTDDRILQDALRRAGLEADERKLDAFRSRYRLALAEEIERPHPGKRVMPGVVELLRELRRRDAVGLGLLTGNYEEAARIKLEHFGLLDFFEFGAYATDAADRNGLVPVALERARARGFESQTPRDVVVIGDTPLDVLCARSNGAVAVGVATGGHEAETLREAGADVVFEDLSDTAGFIEVLGRVRAGNREAS